MAADSVSQRRIGSLLCKDLNCVTNPATVLCYEILLTSCSALYFIGWKNLLISYKECCICHSMTNIRNISIQLILSLRLEKYNVILNENLSYFLHFLH